MRVCSQSFMHSWSLSALRRRRRRRRLAFSPWFAPARSMDQCVHQSASSTLLQYLSSPCILHPSVSSLPELFTTVSSTHDPLVEHVTLRAMLQVLPLDQLIQQHHRLHCVHQLSCLLLSSPLSPDQCNSLCHLLLQQIKQPACDIHCECNFYRLLSRVSSHLSASQSKELICFLSENKWNGKNCLVTSELSLLNKLTCQVDDLSFLQPLPLKFVEAISEKECNFIGQNVPKMTCRRLFTLIHMNWIAKSNNHPKEFLINSWNGVRESMEQVTRSSEESSKHWLVSLMLEDDRDLLNSAFLLTCVLHKLNTGDGAPGDDDEEMHHFTSCLLHAIGNDEHILIEWLTVDAEISVLALKFLLYYLKVDATARRCNVTDVLKKLYHSLDCLTRKCSIPFNVAPLMRLLNKV